MKEETSTLISADPVKQNKASLLKSKNGIRWINWDILAGSSALILGFLLSPYESIDSIKPGFWACVIIFGLISASVSRLIDLPRPGFDFHISRYDILSTAILSVFISTLVFFFIINLLFAYPLKGRYIIIFTGTISYILMCLPRIILTEVSNRNPMKLAIWGCDDVSKMFIEKTNDSPYFTVTGILSNNKLSFTQHLPVLKMTDTPEVDCVVLCTEKVPTSEEKKFLINLPMQGVEVMNKGAFIEKYFRVISLDYLNLHWLASFPSLNNDRTALFAKRIFDLAFSSLMIVLTLPFLPLAAILIKLDSKGSIFYTQTRVGKHNQPFTIYKLRTMVQNSEENGAQWAKRNDARVTNLGRILRRLRIDELPQLWNVLKGEMSMVGPRPERPEFEAGLISKLPLYERRHLVSPGITGWAQIRFKYGSSIEDSKIKLEHDLYYIKHMSFIFDLKVIMKTVVMVMKGSR